MLPGMKPLRMLARVAMPGFLVSLLYLLKYRCYISPKAEVDYTSLIQIGPGTRISSFAQIKAARGPLRIGSNVSITLGCCIATGPKGITIGDDCMLGPRVTIHGTSYRHSRLDLPIRLQEVTSKGVRINNNVWIGAGTVILDGSEIGEGVIVSPNSVVASKLPPNTICEGNPAKPVFQRR